jgi:hypothetical protein
MEAEARAQRKEFKAQKATEEDKEESGSMEKEDT